MIDVSLEELLKMGTDKKEAFLHELESIVGKEFEITYFDSSGHSYLPTLIHRKTRLEFKYIPGGEFDMGFSEKEEQAAEKLCNPIPANIDEMRPVHQVKIQSFIMSSFPIINASLALGLPRLNTNDEYPFYPAYLSRIQAEQFVDQLCFRLPYEQEWEYACRATTKTLFVFGDDLPDDEVLERWLCCDFSNVNKLTANPFGLYGIFTGEWCQDKYNFNYSDDSAIENGSYVIRGGGALFWPWQGEEWVWCMSAMRMPSKDLIDGRCGLRLVRSLIS